MRRSLVSRVASLLAVAGLLLSLGPLAVPVAAVDGARMEASVMLQGHARVGSWVAVRVRLTNDGPPIIGELRLSGGAQGRTRFATPINVPSPADKTYVLYAQPPAFGGALDVLLVANGQTIAKQPVRFAVHDTTQLVVGVVAERPQGIVPELDLLPSPGGARPAIVALSPADLPDRVEAWSAIDRLIWQDVDTVDLTTEQLAALRGWLAAGGRLVIVGGTAGPSVLSGFPDEILPYRPSSTLDVPPDAVSGIVGQLPKTATDLPAFAGALARGRALATSGDRVIAAETAYGSGAVTLLGFDPTTRWIADSPTSGSVWRRFLPPRTGTAVVNGDDGQLVNAVSQLPELALPPIGGLLALLIGYIALIGPVNYLVLRRLDRREWAWITMPILIAVFAAGAYGFGAALRGLDVVLNEVAIVRGAPDATEGTAQVYLGVFSPSRGTYQLEVPGGALLSSTITGDFVNGGDSGALDIVQGDPSQIRDLVVGFGSLRTVRAETATTAPRIQAELALVDGVLKGTIVNLSDQTLEKPALVLGGSVLVLKDLVPNGRQDVSLRVRGSQFGESLSNRILGTVFVGDPTRASGGSQRSIVRHAVIDQLTFDPNTGASQSLPSETPTLLAWGTRQVLDVRVSGQVPRRTGNVLYYIPLSMRVQGTTAFDGELIRSTVVAVDAPFFNKDPFSINMGRGSATVAYRPIAFDGALTATRVSLAMNFGGGDVGFGGPGKPLTPLDPQPCQGANEPVGCVDLQPTAPPCNPAQQDCSNEGFDGIPEVEVFDRSGTGTWMRLPHLAPGQPYQLAHPERYVDPASGTVLVRFVNDRMDGTGFSFLVRIEGNVR